MKTPIESIQANAIRKHHLSAEVAMQDMEKCLEWWDAWHDLGAIFGEKERIASALLTAICVTYMRPFKDGRGYVRYAPADFDVFDDDSWRETHDRAERMRDQLVAHTDRRAKPAEHVERAGGIVVSTTEDSLENLVLANLGEVCRLVWNELNDHAAILKSRIKVGEKHG